MTESRVDKAVGWLGSIAGIGGAILLALNIPASGYGYLLFLMSSIALSAWAYRTGASHALVMQAVFSVINTVGVYNWLIR